jgi:hypothetical protein
MSTNGFIELLFDLYRIKVKSSLICHQLKNKINFLDNMNREWGGQLTCRRE